MGTEQVVRIDGETAAEGQDEREHRGKARRWCPKNRLASRAAVLAAAVSRKLMTFTERRSVLLKPAAVHT